MTGISSRAAGGLENKKGYSGNELQSKEFADGSGLDYYDFNARMYDQQLGRFMQIDPLSEEGDQESWGPFQSNYDNPVRYSDPDGKCPCLIPILVEAAKAAIVATVAYFAAEETGKGLQQIRENIDDKRMRDQPLVQAKASNDKTFNGQNDTKSKTAREALRKAKEENAIPRSQQPDKTVKPNTPEGDQAGLDNRNVKQYEYTNSKGDKVVIRQDKPVEYGDGGNGDQGPHFNAGQNPQKPKDLKQHHYYEKKPWEFWKTN